MFRVSACDLDSRECSGNLDNTELRCEVPFSFEEIVFRVRIAGGQDILRVCFKVVDIAMAENLASMAAQVLDEIQQVFKAWENGLENPALVLVEEIAQAKKRQIVLHGVGREGLMMRAFTMRLYHLGLNAHCLGDMSCPPIGEGDLFIASAGPGSFSSVDALITTARDGGNKFLIHFRDTPPSNSKCVSDRQVGFCGCCDLLLKFVVSE